MKNLFGLMVVLAALVAGCAKSDTTSPPAKTDTTTAPPADTTAPPVTEAPKTNP